jgi:NAD(P)-dependent dehydrogenase (short-subunit alcohol dehydrogenase family)
MSSLFDLSGKVALITGSSQGIGFGIARGLGQAGATIILNGRNEEKLHRGVFKLSQRGSGFLAILSMSRIRIKSIKKSQLSKEKWVPSIFW